MELFAQILVLALFVLGLCIRVHENYQGRPAREPDGAGGLALVLLFTAIVFGLYYFAGTFDRILP